MKLRIVGGVAAGTSAAARASRRDPDAEIVLYEMGRDISYSGCAMPYYLQGLIPSATQLAPRDPEWFRQQYGVRVLTRHRVLSLDPAGRTLLVEDLENGRILEDSWDRLILATGAAPVIPPIPGHDRDRVFVLRTLEDMRRLEAFLLEKNPSSALIAGSGFVGLEMTETLLVRGITVTLADLLPEVAPSVDPELGSIVREHLEAAGVKVRTGSAIVSIGEKEVQLESGERIQADLVFLATGIRPVTDLARAAGIPLGESGAIRVNHGMETGISGIFACGDCAEQYHVLTGEPVYVPLGSTANKTGRVAGDRAAGGDLTFGGVLGTSIMRVLDLTVASTGLTETAARRAGFDPVVIRDRKPSRAGYMGGQPMDLLVVGDRSSGRILGAQIVGPDGVDKRIDVLAAAITLGARASDLAGMDLAYAPPYSLTRDPVLYAGMILEKKEGN